MEIKSSEPLGDGDNVGSWRGAGGDGDKKGVGSWLRSGELAKTWGAGVDMQGETELKKYGID